MKQNLRGQIARTTVMIALVIVSLLGLAGYLAGQTQATTSSPNYDVVLELAAPNPGRPAPYGQWIVTHNNVAISETIDYGTVAKTAGYDLNKAIFCDVNGTYAVTGTLFARTSSTGDVYTLTTDIVFPGNAKTYTTSSYMAPWMSLGLTTGVITESTATCGIYVQTP